MDDKSKQPTAIRLSRGEIAEAFGLTQPIRRTVRKLGKIPRADFDIADDCVALTQRINTVLCDVSCGTDRSYPLRQLKIAWYRATPDSRSAFLNWLRCDFAADPNNKKARETEDYFPPG